MPIDSEDDDPSRMAFPINELEASLSTVSLLQKENHELKQEVFRLRAQLNTLRAHDAERKSILWKKLQISSLDGAVGDRSPADKPAKLTELSEQIPSQGENCLIDDPKESESMKERSAGIGNGESEAKAERLTAVPKAPPSSPAVVSPFKEAHGSKQLPAVAPSPPPPPPPSSRLLVGSKAIRRAPEVMQFYRSLMKRDAQRENRGNAVAALAFANPRNMIGEIENRSTYLLSIKSDVETHGEHINFLAREVETAAFGEISEVEAFVKRLDGELSCLVDERAVLKHFPRWPERKADALREAACSYRDIKSLESEVSSFKDNPKQQLSVSLRKMQALQDRLEQRASELEKVREGTIKKYKEFHIPWKWMLDNGLTGQLKLGSLTLAKEHMQRVAKELKCSAESTTNEEDLLLQGVRFAHRAHQFAGGFDAETLRTFEELRRVGMSGCKQ